MTPIETGTRQQAEPGQERELKGELRQTSDQDAPAQGQNGLLQARRQPEGATDDGQIEQHRGEGGDTEAFLQIERGARQGRQDDEEDIGQRQPQQFRGEGLLLGLGGEAGREGQDQPGGGQGADEGQEQECRAQDAAQAGEQAAQGDGTALAAGLVEHGHQGAGEGALGKEAAEKIRDLEGDEKASVPASAPKRRATVRSRTKPRRRDSRVLPPTLVREADREAMGLPD